MTVVHKSFEMQNQDGREFLDKTSPCHGSTRPIKVDVHGFGGSEMSKCVGDGTNLRVLNV